MGNIDARNGFAPPAPPVICGRRPAPGDLPRALNAPVGCEFSAPVGRDPRPAKDELNAPVGWEFSPPRLDEKPVGCVPRPDVEPDEPWLALVFPFCVGKGEFVWGDSPGVVGADCGIGGSDSRSAAPNVDDGLNGLSPPPKPVFCGCRGLAGETEMDGAEDVIVAPVG